MQETQSLAPGPSKAQTNWGGPAEKAGVLGWRNRPSEVRQVGTGMRRNGEVQGFWDGVISPSPTHLVCPLALPINQP